MMQQDSHFQSRTALPANRSIVLQFRADADLSSDDMAGRVEHVTSGRAERFESMDELMAFLAHVLSSSGQ